MPDAGDTTISYELILEKFRSIEKPIDKYLTLRDLLRLAPRVYYDLLLKHTEEILPYIYTPTVGEACENYHKLPLKTRGLYLTLHDKGSVLKKLQAWPVQEIKVAVITDGERILGLGDLGRNGMGISEGKITLYTAAAGVNPMQCLPICVDIGTNNPTYLEDPDYRGIKAPRVTGAEFDEFMGEVMESLQSWQPHMLVQFEDFGNNNAFRLLESWRHKMCAFNDDIQGTACITLAGLVSAARATGKPFNEHRVLFLGAGEAGTGIGELIATYLHLRHNMTMEEGRQHCFFLDSRGLVCKSRTNLQHHKQPFAHDVEFCPDLKSAIAALKPTALDVVDAMCALNDRPIIFPLSNPTSKSECTYQEAYEWTKGKVLFASGSPFDPITDAGVVHYPAQANNAYIFPAVGYAAVLAKSREITDEMFVLASEELSAMTDMEELEQGRLFPPFQSIRAISKVLTARVAEKMVAAGLGTVPEGCSDWEAFVASNMWNADGL
ncbi:cytosolic NADP malic enzyme [Scenedesmus sp. NREL 46B-D3]|nr:cytosolic NADP malic enzyme [Scenedesmus sp. NREL 46B-D3]